MWLYKNSHKRRKQLAAEQNWRCCYCHGPFTVYGIDHERHSFPSRLTLEHLKRRCEGGTEEYYNSVAACAACNSARHHIPAYAYYLLRQSLLDLWPPSTAPSKFVLNELRKHYIRWNK